MSTNKPFVTKEQKAAADAAAAREEAPEPVADNPTPEREVTPPPVPAAVQTAETEVEERVEPKRGTPQDEARERIAAKFKAQRSGEGEEIEYTGDHREADQNVGSFAPKPAVEEPVADAAPVVTPPAKIMRKINGKEVEITDEMIERAQKVASADEYLAQARAAKSKQETRAAPAERENQRADKPEEETARDVDDDQAGRENQPDPEMVESVRRLQLADPEDAAVELEKIIDKRVNKSARKVAVQADIERRIVVDVEGSRKAVAKFREKNPDINGDPLAEGAIRRGIFDAYREDLRQLGLSEDQLPTNEVQLVDYHRMLRVEGHPVRDMDTILSDVGDQFKAWRGQPAPKPEGGNRPNPTPAPRQGAPRVEVSQQRQERKASVTPQPRSSTPIPAAVDQPEDQKAKRLAAVHKAQVARGQRTAH